MIGPAVVPSNPVEAILQRLSWIMCSISSGDNCMIIQ